MTTNTPRQSYVGDTTKLGVREGMQRLIASVIGEAIKPENTYRLGNGRMNRPEERGGETEAWLASESGKYWLKLADLTGIINSKAIVAIAQDADNDRVGRYVEGDIAVQ